MAELADRREDGDSFADIAEVCIVNEPISVFTYRHKHILTWLYQDLGRSAAACETKAKVLGIYKYGRRPS